MFDDGFDTVTMNLPEGLQGKQKSLVDDDYSAEDILEAVLEEDKSENAEPIRSYSIDLWNGSPGLAHWGYVGKDHWDAERR